LGLPVRGFKGRLMEQRPNDRSANSELTFDPTNKVVGSIDDAGDAKAALSDLRAAGFTAEEVELLTGEEGVRRIGVSDEGGEVLVHIFRPTQKVPAFYDAPVIARRVEEELLAGHYLIGVTAKDGEARERASDILKSRGGHFINFYGPLAAEALEP
jgi:hypothetical protein